MNNLEKLATLGIYDTDEDKQNKTTPPYANNDK